MSNMKQAVDKLEAVVADAAAKIQVMQAEEPPPRPAQTAAEAIANHTNAIVDRATQDALDSIRALRKHLDNSERMLLDNAARLHMEVKSHVSLAALAQSSADTIAEQVLEHRASHADLISPTRAA